MPAFSLTAIDVATPAVVETYETAIALKYADTAGHRGRVRAITIAPGNAYTPRDTGVSVKLTRSSNAGDGTAANDILADIVKKDPASIASNVAAAGSEYSAEPTTYEKPIFVDTFNDRGSLRKEWHDPAEMPVWGKNQSLGILTTIDVAGIAVQLVITVEWDEF